MGVKLVKPSQTTLTTKWSPVSGDGITGYELKYYEDDNDLREPLDQDVSPNFTVLLFLKNRAFFVNWHIHFNLFFYMSFFVKIGINHKGLF